MFRMAPINDFKCEAVTFDALDVLRVCVEIKRDADPAAALVEREIKRVFELTPSRRDPGKGNAGPRI